MPLFRTQSGRTDGMACLEHLTSSYDDIGTMMEGITRDEWIAAYDGYLAMNKRIAAGESREVPFTYTLGC